MMSDVPNEGILRKTLLFTGLLMLISLGFFVVGETQGVAVVSGVMLSGIFVSSSAWVIDTFRNAENGMFIKVYIFSVAIRFLLILLLLGILLGTTKIDEIYFTVSFIISYLCQSVTEIILINKTFQKSSS